MSAVLEFGINLIDKRKVYVDIDKLDNSNILNVGDETSNKTARNIDKIKQLKNKFGDMTYIIVISDKYEYKNIESNIDYLFDYTKYSDDKSKIFEMTTSIDNSVSVAFMRHNKSFLFIDTKSTLQKWVTPIGDWIRYFIRKANTYNCSVINTETYIDIVPFDIIAQSNIIEFGHFDDIGSYNKDLLSRYGLVSKGIILDSKKLNHDQFILSVGEHRIPVQTA